MRSFQFQTLATPKPRSRKRTYAFAFCSMRTLRFLPIARAGRLAPTYLETFRATVAPADCDHLGHMNVQHYFAAVSDGMFAVMVRLGLGPGEIRRRQMSFAVVRAETEFHQEPHAGDVVALESTILKLGEKSAAFHQRLRNVATDALAMSTEFKCVLLDLEKRQASPIPHDIRNAAIKVFSLKA